MTTQREAWLERIRAAVPGGSSTGSKAARFMPEEPAVVERARGGRVWDVDGREFIDFRCGLGPITLGYGFPAVDEAVREQIRRGIVFSHPHRLECEVAEHLIAMIPCAEQVRFLKTGGEAAAACFRLARAFTGRDHVIQIGYNGWLNVLAAGGQYRPGEVSQDIPQGVPAALAALHHSAGWNDRDALETLFEQLPDRIAAVCVSAHYAEMARGAEFYPFLRELTQRNGTLLIYDEIVTGFRIATAGVQEYFKVSPDLAVFAKGVANGMPLSVFCGRRDIMGRCGGGGVTISSTYGGECLSLAAARAVLELYRREDVPGALWRKGETLWGGVNERFEQRRIPMRLRGFWPCPQFVPEADAPADLLDRFFRAAYAQGVVLYRTSYVNYSHTPEDIEEALQRLERAMEAI